MIPHAAVNSPFRLLYLMEDTFQIYGAGVCLGLGQQGLGRGGAGQGCGSSASYRLAGAGTASPRGGCDGVLVGVGVAPRESRQGQ